MVARKFSVHHENSTFDIEYDTDDGLEVFKFQLFSLTSIPPDEQKIVCGDDSKIIIEDSDLISISDKLRLITIDEDDAVAESSTGDSQFNDELLKSDEEFARLLQAEEEALLLQQYSAAEDNGEMEQRLLGYIDQVLMYEDPTRQEAARKTVPIDELEEKALVAIAKKCTFHSSSYRRFFLEISTLKQELYIEGNFEPTKVEQDHAFLLELLIWFKQSFSWVNAPLCDNCGNQTISQGMGVPLPAELQYGGSRVELYCCSFCSRINRFPRYTDPIKLLETRKGRCGEWANCFTLYCRAFGYESRLILDFTDHVWTECFSHHLGRWMHLDPCEGIYDNPLLYEKGWNKKLTYVFAIAKDGVYDVTKRYTRKWHEVLTRRNITTEHNLFLVLENLTKQRRKGFGPEVISLLQERNKVESEGIDRDLHSKGDAAVSLPGRLSGDRQWRISRSEYGSGKGGLSCSSCPVRLCVDEHVSDIYNALGQVFFQFVDSSLSVTSGVHALKTLRGILTDFQKCPFRSRSTIKSSHCLQPSWHHLLPVFGEFLNTLYLKFEVDSKNEVLMHLVGQPVKASLALPVALDALDDLIRNLAKCPSIAKDSLGLPLLRLNRIHSGSVLASGEELPSGIATSAFDGIHSSKWEEPDGAKGGWIAYKLKEERVCKLVAYELMSANDAPERDPMDWIVEGSSDGGSSWYVLDRQTSQKFDSRFQRKLYSIESCNRQSNAFRLTFLSVRDVESTSRLQIGSIDLYAENN